MFSGPFCSQDEVSGCELCLQYRIKLDVVARARQVDDGIARLLRDGEVLEGGDALGPQVDLILARRK